MSRIPSSLLLLAGLLLLGWGIASWLEEGAPWRSLSTNSVESSTNPPTVDVRVLIQEEARRRREPDSFEDFGQVTAASSTGASGIELASGLAPARERDSTPAWLTGEIEF
jgi:hypothetical protein